MDYIMIIIFACQCMNKLKTVVEGVIMGLLKVLLKFFIRRVSLKKS